MKRLCASALLIVALTSCDWDQSSLLNGISLRPEVPKGHVVHVYLAVDGASYAAAVEAQRRGAFEGFQLSKAVPMFPATSDASWSRILHTERFASYEYTYYDAAADTIRNAGLGGVMAHATPRRRNSDLFPYYDAFDVHGTGYLDGVEKYAAPEQMYYVALDQLFVVLAGRLATQTTFSGYLLEVDIAGHYHDEDHMVEMLQKLSDKIVRFKREHPEVTVVFTVISDHGIDNVRKGPGHFVRQEKLLGDVGVEYVTSFADAATRQLSLWAVAPEHTRVTYGTLNTAPELIAPVAQRVSLHTAVDLVVARATPPAGAPEAAQWVSLFLAGSERVRFGFDPSTDTYWLPSDGDYARLDVAIDLGAVQDWVPFRDEDLFLATVNRRYPDLFYRARTSLLPISIRHTADIIYSLNDEYVIQGFSMPLADEAGAGGSHGAMGGRGSEGILLTEEREVPPAIRAEHLLELFPRLKTHLARRGVRYVPGDPNASLDEATLFNVR